MNSLISIIIPAYNAEAFIGQTLKSVKEQSISQWEVIVVNDGSTDNTAQLITAEPDKRIQMIAQQNAGVSAARNNGLKQATGSTVVFLDADDILGCRFLEERLAAFKADEHIGFAGGIQETFPEKTADLDAATGHPREQILFFDPAYSTVPSNYLIRKDVLDKHQLNFNERLSSTADKFFILQLGEVTKGVSVRTSEKGKLFYRVTPGSMSQKMTPKLIKDNEVFFEEVKRVNLLPPGREKEFKSFYQFSLALGFGKIKFWKSFFRYLVRSFFASPVVFSRLLFKRIFSRR